MWPVFGSKCLVFSFYCIVTIIAFVNYSGAKPTSSVNNGEPVVASFSPRLLVREVHPSPRIVVSEPSPAFQPEKSQARAAEGVWQGSARLPSSAKSGGNENSRYTIRRDGSLSISLQGSSSSSTNPPIDHSNSKPNPLPSYLQTPFQSGWNRQDRKITPTELRSFSVVLSDVDVIGTYGQTRSGQSSYDSYSHAGVTGYRLNSNTIHRMNASWKLNPNKTQVDSDQLLHFLSLFSSEAAKKEVPVPSNDEDDDEADDEESRRQQKKTSRRDDTPQIGDNDGGHQSLNYFGNSSSINSLPFSTWSETSRQFMTNRNHNETINPSGTTTPGGSHNHNISASKSNGKSQSQVVLHDLILTLGKLMETKNPENNTSSSTTDREETRRGTHSTTDPQQTAADLKKLMSLLLKSDEPSGPLSSAKDGAQVVNIVITPGSNGSSGTKDEKQKILFLKNHQIQQLLQAAMTDPNLKHVVSKISSALRTPESVHKRNSNSHYDPLYDSSPSPAACSSCIPQEDGEDLLSPSQDPMSGLSPHLTTSSTPDGFPLTGNGFLNLNHPNLQFHQALHHLVANGSAPTTINATTKTNVINIFVLNFNSASTPSVANITQVMTDGKPIVESGDEDESDDYVLPLRPPVVYSLNNYKPGSIITKNDLVLSTTPRPNLQSQGLFFNKMGVPEQEDEDDVEASLEADMDRVINAQSRPQRFKPFVEVTNSHGNPYVAVTPPSTTTSSDRVNILDLLPSHANSFTPVQKFGEATRTQVRPSNPTHHDDPEILDQEAAELFSYLMKAEKETFQGTTNPPEVTTTRTTTEESSSLLPPELAHLSWILNQETPPKPSVGPPPIPVSHETKNKFANKKPPKFYDDEYELDSEENDSGETETSFLRPPNFHIHKRLGNSQKDTKPRNSSSPTTVDPRPLYEQILSSSVLNFTVPPAIPKHPNKHETKGKATTPIPITSSTPKPRPTNIKRRPVQLVSPGDKEQAKQRVRKLMTALGYSALPTLAAGAVATWPYWVPIMATGRKRRRRQSPTSPFPSMLAPKSDKRGFVSRELAADQLFSQLPKEPIEQKVGGEPKMESGPRGRSGMEAEVLGSRSEGPADSSSREKWIRVEVITESSSPTLESTQGSVMRDNNRQFLNGEPQDVPLLKNFLKNVLSNEWNISTTTPPLTTEQQGIHSTPVLNSAGQIRPRPSGSSGTKSPYVAQRPNNSQASSSLSRPSEHLSSISPSESQPASEHSVTTQTSRPSGNNGQQKLNQAQYAVIGSLNDDVERERQRRLRNILAANIREAETAYASAAVLPLWFPIILGNGLNRFRNTEKPDSYAQFQ